MAFFNPKRIKQNKAIVSNILSNFQLDKNLEEPSTDGSKIVDFLKDKHILVTGVTGFFGKVLIEKILRTTTDIGSIFVLARDKKGKDLNARLDEIYNDAVSICILWSIFVLLKFVICVALRTIVEKISEISFQNYTNRRRRCCGWFRNK